LTAALAHVIFIPDFGVNLDSGAEVYRIPTALSKDKGVSSFVSCPLTKYDPG
jgi:hypothetical protein